MSVAVMASQPSHVLTGDANVGTVRVLTNLRALQAYTAHAPTSHNILWMGHTTFRTTHSW